MSEVTRILNAIEAGDVSAADKLLPLLYDELRQLARVKLRAEPTGHSLQATALVHEAFLRLVGKDQTAGEARWNSRGHFFGAAAEAMRRILIDHARAARSQKRGGEFRKIELDAIDHPMINRPEKLLQLDEALQKLEQVDPVKSQLVNLRFFAGLSNREAAKALNISDSTADRYWAYSRAWLQTEMKS